MMNGEKLTCIGVNSGTSVDAIDVVICEISDDQSKRTTFIQHHELPIPRMKVIAFESIAWESHVRDRIFNLMRSNQLSAKEFCEMNALIGKHFALAIENACLKNNIDLKSIDVIGSHGQTIYHQVESNKFIGSGGESSLIRSTLQIGEPGEISAYLRLPVISNFRTNDVALSGQGAPLTSIFDFLMLRHPTKWRAIQNIGGIGNVTFVPPLNIQVEDSSSLTVSFDTGPGNALIDDCVRVISNNNLQMDENGDMARSVVGLDKVLFEKLLTIYDPYIQMPFPKTTGRELFGRDQVEKLLEPLDLRTTDKSDPLFCSVVNVFTEFTAYSIVKAYEMVCNKLKVDEFDVIVSGGGQKNSYLIQRLSHLLNDTFQRSISIYSHEKLEDGQALDSNAKEGMLFALLAYLYEKKRVSNIPSVTGAKRAVILGSKTQAL